eukprot:TRINITY_DN6971_c0_g1_i1.p1 TRINITY_DN6971_c0_g1~~TRINITY_DN6971_c0_g1_i1.p1  ORF type:complete len:211 (+),score=27.71 TRINITY_DN6971_c0_g1_i1:94-726(+)
MCIRDRFYGDKEGSPFDAISKPSRQSEHVRDKALARTLAPDMTLRRSRSNVDDDYYGESSAAAPAPAPAHIPTPTLPFGEMALRRSRSNVDDGYYNNVTEGSGDPTSTEAAVQKHLFQRVRTNVDPAFYGNEEVNLFNCIGSTASLQRPSLRPEDIQSVFGSGAGLAAQSLAFNQLIGHIESSAQGPEAHEVPRLGTVTDRSSDHSLKCR